MENRNILENLITKYLNGTLTTSERRQINEFIADDANETLFKELILKHLYDFTEENSINDKKADFDEVYSNILAQIDKGHQNIPVKRQPVLLKVLYVLSAAAVLTGAFFLGKISDFKSDTKVQVQPSYTEVKSPYGSKSEIKLPDGTTVILNAGSTLKYNNDYNQSNRDIDLYGEAYFKVAKNIPIPLIVSAGYIDVIATGTEFNIKAYPEENTIETTLVEGKVEISNSNQKRDDEEFIDLVPNQKAIFYKGEDRYELENINKKKPGPVPVKPFLENVLISPKADIEKTVAWTEGRLIFRGESLENLCIDLQRKYDVKFVFIEEDLKKFRFTGVLLDETLEQVLGVIKLAAPVDFSLEAKTVYLFTDVKKLDGFKERLKCKEL